MILNNSRKVLSLLSILCAVKLCGPSIHDGSHYESSNIILDDNGNSIWVRTGSESVYDAKLLVSKSYGSSPTWASLALMSVDGISLSVEQVTVVQQELRATYSVNPTEASPDQVLRETLRNTGDPSYYLKSDELVFGEDIELRVLINKCTEAINLCETSEHVLVIPFIEKPAEFRFSTIDGMMSV